MDNLIFYKKNVDLQPVISKIRFSYTREYSLIFTKKPKELKDHLMKVKNGLLFFFTDNLDQSDRISITNIKNVFPNIDICLCSNKIFALDAWHLHVFHFVPQPTTNVALEESYKKHVSNRGGADKELKVKTKEGIVRIPFKMINYLRGKGNYTHIGLRGGKTFLETKQLGQYEYFSEIDLNMKRLNRSYIFNMSNIKIGGEQSITFYATEKKLELSKSLATLVRRTLLSK